MKLFFRKLAYRLKTPPPEHWRRQLVKLLWLLLLPLALGLKELAASDSAFVEKAFSSGVYPVVAQALGFLFGWMPFSLAEILLYAVVVGVPVYLVVQIVLMFVKGDKVLRLFRTLVNLAVIVSAGYFLFIALWGLNYYRQPVATTLGYKVAPRSVEDLKRLCTLLVEDANELRAGLTEDSKGCMVLKDGKQASLLRVPEAYQALSRTFPQFKTKSQPKPVLLSRYMSFTDIAGIFIPFTMEPNVNVDMPDIYILSTACHEAAHGQGFAREDEANFLSYMACMASGDQEMMYSGTMLALTTSMNMLASYDSNAYNEIACTYDPAIWRDLHAQNEYWKQFEGPVAETSSKMNNAYLKSNKQADGVNSYGRMVDLLLAQMLTEEQN